jgi:hypothetical protein
MSKTPTSAVEDERAGAGLTVHRSPISLADVLRAVSDLAPGDKPTRKAIVEMLVTGTERVQERPTAIGAWKPSLSETVAQDHVPGAPQVAVPAKPVMAARAARTKKAVTKEVDSSLAQHSIPTLAAPKWMVEGSDLPTSTAAPFPSMPAVPLFGRLGQRGLLSLLVSTLVEGYQVDIARILAAVAEGKAVTRMPRLRVPTTRRGAQVLLDRGSGLDPFRGDQDQLIRAFDDILADDRLQVLQFHGSPARGVFGIDDEDIRPWEPPSPRVPIVLVTDLGIGGSPMRDDRAGVAEWAAFACRVRAAGHPTIALVPYEARRWPAPLTRRMTLVHWSERTTIGEVRRGLRDVRHGVD